MRKTTKILGLAVALAAAPTLAFAHPGLHAAGFSDGFIHPFTGFDHLLAMVAVGYWAASMAGAARWAVPMSFLALMIAGGALGFHAEAPAVIEYGIAASVVVLGGLVAFDVRLPVGPAAALVGTFAFCHGFAHGAEAPNAASGWHFGAGFVLATLLLQSLGLGLGALRLHRSVARIAGALIAASGCWFALNA